LSRSGNASADLELSPCCASDMSLKPFWLCPDFMLFGVANERNLSGHASNIKISVFVFQTTEIMHALLIQCQYCNTRKFFKKPAYKISVKNFWQSVVTTCGAFALPCGSPWQEAISPDDMRCFGTNMWSDEEDAAFYLVDEKNTEEGGQEDVLSSSLLQQKWWTRQFYCNQGTRLGK
jgi:DNA-directed RNA polymerase subunit RPC12/RpoP